MGVKESLSCVCLCQEEEEEEECLFALCLTVFQCECLEK